MNSPTQLELKLAKILDILFSQAKQDILKSVTVRLHNLTDTKHEFSRILVAVDGSETSMDAAGMAIDMARMYNAQLTALTVSHISLSSYGLAAPPDAIKQRKEKHELESKRWFDELNQNARRNNIQFKTQLIDSQMSVEGTIVEYAENNGIDLIVLGTRGRSGIKKLLLGSVASGVISYATCPVIVVK
jgi:nucleotide-binding universal stress UspA family protein